MNSSEKAGLIQLKVGVLLKQLATMEQEIKALRSERDGLLKNLDAQTKRIEKLEDQNKISKLADGIHLGKRDITEVKLEINRYVREIDECLKLLNQIPDNN